MFFKLGVNYGKQSPELKDFKAKHPDWEYAYGLFIAWTVARVNNQNQTFLKLVKDLS